MLVLAGVWDCVVLPAGAMVDTSPPFVYNAAFYDLDNTVLQYKYNVQNLIVKWDAFDDFESGYQSHIQTACRFLSLVSSLARILTVISYLLGLFAPLGLLCVMIFLSRC
jgi:hypothetical protein